MTYVLHGARGSGSAIVEAALACAEVEYTVRDLDLRAHEQRGDAYAALNPQRKLPTLQCADGEVLSESVAILLILAERHPEAGLLPPPGTRDRARALRWMLFAAAELYPIIEIVDYPGRFAPPDAAAAVRARALDTWRRRWLVLEGELPAAPRCVATGFSATDLYIAVLSRWDMPADWRREHLPRVEAIAAAVRERPAIAPVWARHFG